MAMDPPVFVVPDISADAARPSPNDAVAAGSDCGEIDGDMDEHGAGASVSTLPMFVVPMPLPTSMEVFNSVFFGLTRQLCIRPWASEVNPIPTASVPVIKLRAAADVLLASSEMHGAQLMGHAWGSANGTLLSSGDEEVEVGNEPTADAQTEVPAEAALRPFHLASGSSVAVDITIDCCGLRGPGVLPWLGDRADRFVLGCLRSRSNTLAAVVRVVKALLSAPDIALHVPFTGGMSSYSVFLMTLAAYDRCVHMAMHRVRTLRTAVEHGSPASTAGSQVATAMHPVSEGDVLLHTLQLFSVGFDPARQGVDVRADPSLAVNDDVAPTSLFLFDLTPEQQATVAGGGVWIADPLEPIHDADFDGQPGAALATRTGPASTSNVARPSFAYRQVQRYFLRCLEDIERKCGAPAAHATEVELLPLRMSDFH
jgi:hypothetical protein